MITVTERAATALESLLADNGAQPGQGVKLVPATDGSVGMVIEAPADGDEIVRRGQSTLVIVDSTIADRLDGAQIDCEDVMNGQTPTKFTLKPPSD